MAGGRGRISPEVPHRPTSDTASLPKSRGMMSRESRFPLFDIMLYD
jgi:hypothetical protein